jgi:Ni,Fe-hydrogenase III large subunit/Ni,Fe-hydrogenase III component G
MTATTAVGLIVTAEQVFHTLREQNARLVSIFGYVDQDGQRWVHYLLDIDGHEYRVFHVPVRGPIPSATSITPAAAWYERELRDQFGVEISGHPDPRPLLFHENWPDHVHPLLEHPKNIPVAHREYSFLKVDGMGVCEIPVGPVHAGIIEPGHFRFSVVGDTILNLELRHFYTHKGTEKLFQGTPVFNGSIIAESVSGDNCFAHAVAYCQAVENACRASIPARAASIRLVGLEIERILAHIADVGALCGDVGFSVPAAYTARLKESLLRESVNVMGTRFWRGVSIPGGLTRNISSNGAAQLRKTIANIGRDFADLAAIILETPSVQNRFETTGILKADIARSFAVVGPVARASGIAFDVRSNHPYGAYCNRAFEPITYQYGDVLARARVRIDETAASVRLLQEVLENLPPGDVLVPLDPQVNSRGFSAVESPRGELLYWLEIRDGRIGRCHVKSPSFQNWPAMPFAMPGNIVADFPLINKSFNLSYSGCDR